jgi:hypothetical protein
MDYAIKTVLQGIKLTKTTHINALKNVKVDGEILILLVYHQQLIDKDI